VVAGGADTVWTVASRLRWSRPWPEIGGFMRRAALGEAQAHLIELEHRGRVAGSGEAPRRWSAAARPD
jgi:hypothetical protein